MNFSRLTAFDWVKVSLYGTAICSVITVGALNSILRPWGMSDAEISVLSAKVGSLGALFALIGLIFNTLKNPSTPTGFVPAILPKTNNPSTPVSILNSVTTAEAVKKGP